MAVYKAAAFYRQISGFRIYGAAIRPLCTASQITILKFGILYGRARGRIIIVVMIDRAAAAAAAAVAVDELRAIHRKRYIGRICIDHDRAAAFGIAIAEDSLAAVLAVDGNAAERIDRAAAGIFIVLLGTMVKQDIRPC